MTINSCSDPENIIGSRYPKWLQIMKTKFENALVDSGATEKARIFRVGRFAVFLSLCAEGSITCTDLEKDALREVCIFIQSIILTYLINVFAFFV